MLAKSKFVVAWLLAMATVSGCTAHSISPPLSSKPSSFDGRPGYIGLTSGRFQSAHEVLGVVQMTQTGYRWFHAVEVVDDANPGMILVKLARFAHENGADGIQHLELIDLKPQNEAERISKQVNSAVRISNGNSSVAEEGSETRWEIRGELVRFSQRSPR